jgi:pyridoxamine 5'-phosphate oxidase
LAEYTGQLLENDLDSNPFTQFGKWFDEAQQRQADLPEAMTVATASTEGCVSARVCLLKGYDSRGFTFFTNYSSRKAAQLHDNPRAALCWWWPVLGRQVRVEGAVVRTTEEESEAYFATRARGSQLGAWASDQSKPIVGRGDLDERFRQLEATYRVIPVMFEFWQGRADRLHDRFTYRLREAKDWVIERVAP